MRKIGLLLAATLAVTTACKSSGESDEKPTAGKQVEQAQEESKQAYERAKGAQEKAIEEQKQVSGAMDEVTQKRQELADAEAKAQRAQQESQQAQATAQQEGLSAAQQAQQAQQRATQEQQQQVQQEAQQAQAQEQESAQSRAQAQQQARTPPPTRGTDSQSFEANAPSGTRSLAHGALDQASSDEIVIHREASEPLRIKIDSNTKVERDGAAATATDLAKGNNVTVTYRIEGSQPIAERVHIVP